MHEMCSNTYLNVNYQLTSSGIGSCSMISRSTSITPVSRLPINSSPSSFTSFLFSNVTSICRIDQYNYYWRREIERILICTLGITMSRREKKSRKMKRTCEYTFQLLHYYYDYCILRLMVNYTIHYKLHTDILIIYRMYIVDTHIHLYAIHNLMIYKTIESDEQYKSMQTIFFNKFNENQKFFFLEAKQNAIFHSLYRSPTFLFAIILIIINNIMIDCGDYVCSFIIHAKHLFDMLLVVFALKIFLFITFIIEFHHRFVTCDGPIYISRFKRFLSFRSLAVICNYQF